MTCPGPLSVIVHADGMVRGLHTMMDEARRFAGARQATARTEAPVRCYVWMAAPAVRLLRSAPRDVDASAARQTTGAPQGGPFDCPNSGALGACGFLLSLSWRNPQALSSSDYHDAEP